ncbi:MAG TPA: hypothetical protein VIY49_10605 [Bryobacteraceae bacterium]
MTGNHVLLLLFPAMVNAWAESQPDQYQANVPKTIVELQQFRETTSIPIGSKGGKESTATLINLNPAINAWFLLEIGWGNGRPETAYHLENPKPRSTRILLDQKNPSGLSIMEGATRYSCNLFGDSPNALERGKASSLVFYPLCEGRLYLRNPATGHRTTLEAAVEFLREHVWGGEKIVNLGHILMGDVHRETGTLEPGTLAAAGARHTDSGDLPLPASIDSQYTNRLLTSANLGIDLEGPPRTGMLPGAWYPVLGNPGVYASILQPNLIEPSILGSYRNHVNGLDSVEAPALCYLVAFDLDRFDLGYALGTAHPNVGWSEEALPQVRSAGLPGPDGISSISPLVATGLLSPQYAPRTIATFTGGFKRTQGAFKFGDLALRNHGSHYGFLENGVVFSKLQPGLATVFVLNDGSIGMKTWTDRDDALLPKIEHARQNGVSIIESGVPGPLVNRWGAGNWSGSAEGTLRTLRSGAAVQTNGRKRFLIYAVFSDATPSAMARVFQAYRCDYAMLLDMNALEHAYLAIYRRSGSRMFVDHLVKGMNIWEKSSSGEVIPRFLGLSDNRDFFYVMRRENKP